MNMPPVFTSNIKRPPQRNQAALDAIAAKTAAREAASRAKAAETAEEDKAKLTAALEHLTAVRRQNYNQKEIKPMTELENPIRIDRIERTATKEGKPIVAMYSEPLDFAVLTLFESQFGMLFDVDIDPNTLTGHQYARFMAEWEQTDKKNGKGNPYKNAVALRPMPQMNDTAVQLTTMIALLQEIRDILAPGASAAPAVPVAPSPVAPTVSEPAESQPGQTQTAVYHPREGDTVRVRGNKSIMQGTIGYIGAADEKGDRFFSLSTGGKAYTLHVNRIIEKVRGDAGRERW